MDIKSIIKEQRQELERIEKREKIIDRDRFEEAKLPFSLKYICNYSYKAMWKVNILICHKTLRVLTSA